MPAKIKTIRLAYDDTPDALIAMSVWASAAAMPPHDGGRDHHALVALNSQLHSLLELAPKPPVRSCRQFKVHTVADAQGLLEAVARAYRAAEIRQPFFFNLARVGAFSAARNLLAWLSLPAEARQG